MRKFNIRKNKFLILTITIFAVISSLSCAFAVYIVENDINHKEDINPIEVNVVDNVQKLIKYNNCN